MYKYVVDKNTYLDSFTLAKDYLPENLKNSKNTYETLIDIALSIGENCLRDGTYYEPTLKKTVKLIEN